jgi:hypothetical protein
MIFLLALLPATMLTVAGYVVLYVSHRSEGGLRSFGRYLSFWAFTLAALVVVGGVVAAAHAGRMHGCGGHGFMLMRGCGEGAMERQCPLMHPWHHPVTVVPEMGPATQGRGPGVPAAPPGTAPEPAPPK